MSRTPEQRKADDQLHEAIQATLEAYGYKEDYFVADWVVLTAQTRFAEDGETLTAYSSLFKDGDLPWYRIMGLMEAHRLVFQRNYLANGDNG